jgi:hypothetical protein
MRRTWQQLSLATVLVAALTPAPVPAGSEGASGTKSDTPPDAAQQMADLKKSVDKLSERVRTIEQNIDKDLKELRGTIADLGDKPLTANLAIARLQQDLRDQRTQLAQMREELERLRPSSSSVSGYAGAGGTAAPTGSLRLVNTWRAPVTVLINRTPYEVQPDQVRIVNGVPAGEFSYEVLGIQPRRARTLAPGEVFSVTIYPGLIGA